MAPACPPHRRALRVFAGNAPVQEECLGLLAALTLRMPAIASAAADAGAIEALMEVLESQAVPTEPTGAAAAAPPSAGASNGISDGTGISNGGVARQACMAIRNMVVRNPELRGPFLDKGAEALVRGVKARYAGSCGDVGSAALRDLGLEQYQ